MKFILSQIKEKSLNVEELQEVEEIEGEIKGKNVEKASKDIQVNPKGKSEMNRGIPREAGFRQKQRRERVPRDLEESHEPSQETRSGNHQ